jgi:ketosteroid isomerase-like protein
MRPIQPAICILFATLLVCCNVPSQKENAVSKAAIEQAERDFAAAAQQGIADAFYQFADSQATILRAGDSLISGKEAIRNYYRNDKYRDARVNWSADFVGVSDDGSLGYTYGKYTWELPGDSGQVKTYSGVFHTVWKRQADGSWKYVWD